MRKRLLFTVMLLMLSLSIVLAGCGKNNASSPQEDEKTPKDSEITFMIPEWGVPSDEMLDEFTKETGIKVNVETVAWDDIRNKISVAANGKKAPADVVEVDWSWVGEFDSAGWFEPITLSEEDIKEYAKFIIFYGW